MAQKIFVVEGRQFRTESDYACAKRDKVLIDRLRLETDFQDRRALKALRDGLLGGKYRFLTLLGQDFQDEVTEALAKAEALEREGASGGRRQGKRGTRTEGIGSGRRAPAGRKARFLQMKKERQKAKPGKKARAKQAAPARQKVQPWEEEDGLPWEEDSLELERIVARELRKREKRRRLILSLCSVVAVGCLGYFGVYAYYDYRTQSSYQALSELKEKPVTGASAASVPEVLYTLNGEAPKKEVLEEYRNLLLKNRRLIGWVKVDGTYIDYPVMQTVDNEYYLDHNMEQKHDKNGTIFLDKDCDVLKPSTNFILYGHHMKNGRMFGQLDLYKDKSFYEKHPYINFDTIYEKGKYEIMYVFRSRVYKETEIVFKYYQFIEANGEREFDSNMEEMAALSLYDTGVTAQYGDQLLTLSTCDYQETDGRFVVVAKKIAEGTGTTEE